MKKRRIILLAVIGILIIYLFDAFYVPYKEIKIEYLGIMKGEDRQIFWIKPEDWTDEDIEGYMYNFYTGYVTFYGQDIIDRYDNGNYEFRLDIEDEQRYVMSYGYPIKSLQYTRKHTAKRDKGYYNRAKMDTENYREGVWFIYKMEDIHLGNMIYEEVDYIDGVS